MTKKSELSWILAALLGWSLFAFAAILLCIAYVKYERANEEAWRNLDRATVAETAYEKMEKYVERLENRPARYNWKRSAMMRKTNKEDE